MTLSSLFLLLLFSVVFYTDFKDQIIPDFVPFGLVTYALLMSATGHPLVPLRAALAGVLIGWACTFAFALVGGMGLGDVKLLAALGLWLGYRTFDVFLLAPIIGLVFVLYYWIKTRNRKAPIPFGPALVLAAALLWFSHASAFQLFDPLSRLVFGAMGIR